MIIPLCKFSRVGHSYHFGSAKCRNRQIEEDINSVISKQFKSVLVVDGSAIPNMPAGPPTLSLMAYAYKTTKNVLINN